MRKILVVVALVLATLGAAPTAAEASVPGHKCDTFLKKVEGQYHSFTLCVYLWSNWTVSGTGKTSHHAYTTIFVQQCRPINNVPVDCVDRGAVFGDSWHGLEVSPRTAYWGYIYRTCGSADDGTGGRWVYVCSPWESAP